jgi:hypothetical protein
MFEHLGPIPEVSVSRKQAKYKLYLSLLSLAVFVFIFSWGAGQGAGSKAQEPPSLKTKVFVDQNNKKIVSTAKNFSIFDFVIDVDQPNVALYKLNIFVDGIYDITLLNDLKLFHEGVQLGEISQIDSQGKIYFDLSEYSLQKGQNKFSLFFNNGSDLKIGSALNFSIRDQEDIFLMSDGHIFRPQADFPMAGGLISIIEQGQVVGTNAYVINDFLISSAVPQQIASFELSSVGEKTDLRTIVLNYNNLDNEDLEDLDFFLIYQNNKTLKARSDNNQIVFELPQTIALNDLDREVFDLHALALPAGDYQFYLQDVKAKGVLSGVDIYLNNSVKLSKVKASPYFIEMSTGDLDTRLSSGWNKIYALDLSTRGIDEAYLNKITWAIDSQNLNIESLELWKDGQSYIANLVLKDDRLIVKMAGDDPLLIGQDSTEILLLANLNKLGKKAKIETVILEDNKALDEDSLEGNIIWSVGEEFYNGYQIPYLPLQPSILAN